MLVEGSGVRIEGGRLHGLSFEQREMQSEAWRVRQRGRAAVLVIDLPGVYDMQLAETYSRREERSFAELAETVRRSFGPEPDLDAPAGSHLLLCGSCGAEATPADEPSVECRYCMVRVSVPDDLRERIRASAAHRGKLARREQLLSALLRQPGALATNRLSPSRWLL